MDLTVVGQSHPSFNVQISVKLDETYLSTLPKSTEFPQIYRKYLNQEIFYKILLIFILLEEQIIPRTRNALLGGAPSYVCLFCYPFIFLSSRPFAHNVISGTVYFSNQHIYYQIDRLIFFCHLDENLQIKLIIVSDS